jgi:hypothetical protein
MANKNERLMDNTVEGTIGIKVEKPVETEARPGMNTLEKMRPKGCYTEDFKKKGGK